MSLSPSNSEQEVNWENTNLQAPVPWFARSPFFDARCMSLTTLQKSQQNLHFIDENLCVLKRSETGTSLRTYKIDEGNDDRDRLITEVVQTKPELIVLLISQTFGQRDLGELGSQQGHLQFSVGLSEDNFQWLMSTMNIHPLFLESLHSNVGQCAMYETFDQGGNNPLYLHLLIKAPPSGYLRAALYLRHEYATQKLLVIIMGNDLDAQTEQLVSHLKLNDPPFDPFAIALSIVTQYHWFLDAQKTQTHYATIMTERETGRGTFAYQDGQTSRVLSPDKFDLTFMHWIEGNQRNIVYGCQFQVYLAQFLVEQHLRHLERTQRQKTHGKLSTIISTAHLQDFDLTPAQRTLHSRLLSHLSSCIGLHSASLVVCERIQRQLSAADSIINQYDNKVSLSNAEANMSIAEQSRRIAEESKAIAAETRRDSTSMKTIASLTMVYLPCTFAASVFSTGFFSYSNDASEFMKVNPQIWKLFVVAISLSIVTVGVWVWLNKSGIPKWLNWARQRQSATTEKQNDTNVSMTLSDIEVQRQSVNLDTLRARLNRPPLEVVSAPKICLPV